ncbi:MAG: VanZ family protein [Clostridia bacterium]|nr:VanZ family protein [Clostridia bacterium]
MEKSKKDKIFYAIIFAVILANLLWIFVQSSLPMEVSEAESDKVTEVVDKVVPEEVSFKEFLLNNIRKIAHFVEFGTLGLEAFLLLWYSRRMKISTVACALGLGALVAFFDETVQIFSKRGAAILDVWIDIGGFASFFLLPVAVYILVSCIKHKNETKNSISA